LREACQKTDWQVHGYCLMRNHFRLVVETPRANLVAGIKWLLGTYTMRYNRRQKVFGSCEEESSILGPINPSTSRLRS